jgi:hypothetical protein
MKITTNMKSRKHKTTIGKYCCHLKKWFIVNILCVDTIPCDLCKKEVKDRHIDDDQTIERI